MVSFVSCFDFSFTKACRMRGRMTSSTTTNELSHHNRFQHPQLVSGTASVGDKFTTTGEVDGLLDALKRAGVARIDTAPRYPPLNPGRSETLLGESGVASRGFTVDTKIAVHGSSAAGSLRKEKIDESIAGSYERLGVEKINILYCHAPDFETPLEETAAALDRNHKKGLFNEFGISHFPVKMVKDLVRVCEENGYVKPTFYQGHYNALSREDEEELFPVLREHGIKYAAHSVLAGGFLTGKLTSGEEPRKGSRFDRSNSAGGAFREQYDTPVMHTAMLALQDATDAYEIGSAEAALRWVAYHSALRPEDAIILGGSKAAHMILNVEYLKRGPLPDEIVDALETAWRALAVSRYSPSIKGQ